MDQRPIISALPVKRFVSQEGWHNWHFTGCTLAGFCFLGLTSSHLQAATTHHATSNSFGHGYAPNAILKGFWEATVDERALFKKCTCPALGKSLFGQFWSQTQPMLCAAWDQGQIVDQTSPEKESPELMGVLCPQKENTDAIHKTTLTVK